MPAVAWSADPVCGWRSAASAPVRAPGVALLTDYPGRVLRRLSFRAHRTGDIGAFDAAVCMCTLNHCANPVAALRETARVVRTGGHVLLVLEDGEPLYTEILSGEASHYLIESRCQAFRGQLTSRWAGGQLRPSTTSSD